MDAVQKRVADQRLIDARQQMSPHQAQLPPFHFPNSEMLWIIAPIDPRIIRQRLPSSLRPAPSMTAALGLWHSAAGSPFGDVVGYVLTVEVEGIESPDGMPGQFICEEGVSRQALSAYRTFYHPDIREVEGSFSRQGGALNAEIMVAGQPHISLRVHGTSLNIGNSGHLTYICETRDAEIVCFPSNWSGPVLDGVIENMTLGTTASELLRALRPERAAIVWQFDQLDFITGTPQIVADSVFERSRSLPVERLLELLGRPAAIVSRTGKVLASNRGALELLGDERLRSGNNREQLALSKALERATQGPASMHSAPLSLTTAERTLLVRIFALDRATGDDARALAFLTDPRIVLSGDTIVALQLLGLTGAEARLAAVVGAGASGRQAAASLKLTPRTVSSTLKLVYAKLGIRKQSELAKVVANVGMV